MVTEAMTFSRDDENYKKMPLGDNSQGCKMIGTVAHTQPNMIL